MKSLSIILLVLFGLFADQNNPNIVRMNTPSFSGETVKTDTIYTSINDTIPDKNLVVYLDNENHPIKYSRNIETGVCIDGECRLVLITLFWNLNGRYLGFELPDKEFLSKKEHDPFTDEDYDRLHLILNEENSPLSQYEIDELVPTKDKKNTEVDAVSSATLSAILQYIVEDAVYTTYTLWHIVYGPTRREIEKQTTSRLDSKLVLKVLNSENKKDQIWALNHFPGKMKVSDELQQKLIQFIGGEDIYLAERALNAFPPKLLSERIQNQLSSIFIDADYLHKKLILKKLESANKLSPQTVNILSSQMSELNGTLIKNVLDLFSENQVKDNYTEKETVKLLNSPNRYVAKQAADYLQKLEEKSAKTMKAVNKYNKN